MKDFTLPATDIVANDKGSCPCVRKLTDDGSD